MIPRAIGDSQNRRASRVWAPHGSAGVRLDQALIALGCSDTVRDLATEFGRIPAVRAKVATTTPLPLPSCCPGGVIRGGVSYGQSDQGRTRRSRTRLLYDLHHGTAPAGHRSWKADVRNNARRRLTDVQDTAQGNRGVTARAIREPVSQRRDCDPVLMSVER